MKHPGTVTPEPVPEIGSDELHFMFARLRQVAGRLTQRYSSMAQSVDGKAFSFQPAARMAGFDAPTVWHEFTPLANQHKAINLGQGFPDWAPPSFIKDALFRAVDDNLNAYTRSAGHLSLCERLAADYTEKLGHKVNPLTDVVVTVGSTQALFSLMQGMLQEGDEVIAFEPSFDIYVAQAKMAGATLKTVPLRVVDGRWTFDASELAATFSKRSRILIVNSPHNPTGKVFTPAEYEAIAAIVQQHPDCVVVTDEVYEHMVFSGQKHTYLASLPGMQNRTITMCSAGKTFSITGWKVGWLVGPEHLIKPAALAHQWVAFCISTPMQEAVGKALDTAKQPFEGHASYYAWVLAEYTRKREILSNGLRAAGLRPLETQGSFFIMADTCDIAVPETYLYPNGKDQPPAARDYAFCRFLTTEIGVAAIPPSAFMCDENKSAVANYARFAFCKKDETLHAAVAKLAKLAEYRKSA